MSILEANVIPEITQAPINSIRNADLLLYDQRYQPANPTEELFRPDATTEALMVYGGLTLEEALADLRDQNQ